jgi:hypothetical protein
MFLPSLVFTLFIVPNKATAEENAAKEERKHQIACSDK